MPLSFNFSTTATNMETLTSNWMMNWPSSVSASAQRPPIVQ